MTGQKGLLLITGILITVAAILITGYNISTWNQAQDYREVMGPARLPWMLGGTVLDTGSGGDPDDKSVESPTVIKLADSSYVMWYRGQSFADKTGRIMRAVSRDGLQWEKTGVVMIPSEEYEGNKIDPMSVIYEKGIYKMWYGADSYGGCACYATSSDGINWTRYSDNPVLRKTSGSWDNEGAGGQHSVIKVGNKYLMYYKGFGKQNPGSTFYGLAESGDGITWIKKGKILSPDPTVGDTTIFRNLCAFKLDNYYCIMYTMVEYLDLFLASSSDGKNWIKNGLVFAHGCSPNKCDEKWSTSPSILIEDNTVRMWYEGGDINGRVRTLYAAINKDMLLKAVKNTIKKN